MNEAVKYALVSAHMISPVVSTGVHANNGLSMINRTHLTVTASSVLDSKPHLFGAAFAVDGIYSPGPFMFWHSNDQPRQWIQVNVGSNNCVL